MNIFFISCLGLLAVQRHYLVAEDARSPWWSCGKQQGLCLLAYLSNRRQVFSTVLVVGGWEAGISESGAQRAFLPWLLDLWVRDDPDKLH